MLDILDHVPLVLHSCAAAAGNGVIHVRPGLVYGDRQPENYDGFGGGGEHPANACVTRRATTAGYDGN